MTGESRSTLCITGIVLAAGRGRRMGGPLKQTLPWPPVVSELGRSDLASPISNLQSEIPDSSAPRARSTVISCAFDAIAPFCHRMFVVVGGDAHAINAALGERTFTRVDADSDAEMFESIRVGVDAVNEDANVDAVMLQPGDHPGVARATIEALRMEFQRDPRRAVMPEYAGKGGHPVIIPRGLLPSILNLNEPRSMAGGGLRQFWSDHPEARTRLVVSDPLCIADIDTPQDYVKSLRHSQ